MPTDVVMPQMGESIAEGTIVRWIKKVGDTVERDEPLFEISTDKVDAEIPAPAAGVLTEIRHLEGETVPVNAVVAVIGLASEAVTAASSGPPPATSSPVAPAAAPAPPRPAQADGATAVTPDPPPPASKRDSPTSQGGSGDRSSSPTPTPPPSAKAETVPQQAPEPPSGTTGRQRSSPLVRKIAREHDVDISQLQGTGVSGRVTRDDILGFISRQEPQRRGEGEAPASAPPAPSQPAVAAKVKPVAGDRTEKMSVMRKRIAEHMVASRRTSAHVHTVFEVNFSRVAQIRETKKREYEAAGGKLTFLSFIMSAVVEALRAVPVVNASVDGDNIVYHQDINLGVAVALDWGLIVPVIKNAGEKNLLGLSRAVADLAARARAKQLKPEEVSGGTFTITNPGVFGALFGMPIINQPQLAILGVGAIEKRPVVIDDAIAIRPMGYLTLGYDHRVIDGAVADEFLSHLKRSLEDCDPAIA